MKIDWEKVWIEYDLWTRDHFVTWNGMKKKIQSLVEQQLRKKVKRRKK